MNDLDEVSSIEELIKIKDKLKKYNKENIECKKLDIEIQNRIDQLFSYSRFSKEQINIVKNLNSNSLKALCLYSYWIHSKRLPAPSYAAFMWMIEAKLKL